MRKPQSDLRIAIDLSQIDNQTLGSGQYRYAVDLVNGLAVSAPDIQLLLLGSMPQARADFVPALEQFPDRCRYIQLRPYFGRGYYYFDNLRLSCCLAINRVNVFHQLHTNIPPLKTCPIVVTGYHYHYDSLLFASRPHRYYRWALRGLTDLVITISDATLNDFYLHYRVPREQMRTVYLGLSNSFAVRSPAMGPRAPYLLSPYNLLPTKNLRALVLAWPVIAERFSDLELVLYGCAHVCQDNEAEFDQLLNDLPHHERIRRIGYVSDAELATLFAECELFIFPTTVEGFGYPLLEAMAQGACCVARNASAMREVGGDAVCLVETLHPQEIARAAIELLLDSIQRAELKRRGRERAKRFTVDAMVQNTLECYRSVCRDSAQTQRAHRGPKT